MMRFIFVCMAIVALSMVAVGVGGLNSAHREVEQRNNPAAIATPAEQADAGPSFEEIYEGATAAMDVSPEALNMIETAAGENADDAFSGPFTDEAPAALRETPAPVLLEEVQSEENSDN